MMCPGNVTEVDECKTSECPGIINCFFSMVTNFESYNVSAIAAEWQDWGHWSQCTASCGQGLKIRARGCSEPEFGGDLLCSGNGTEVEGCNSAECPGNPLLYPW